MSIVFVPKHSQQNPQMDREKDKMERYSDDDLVRLGQITVYHCP